MVVIMLNILVVIALILIIILDNGAAHGFRLSPMERIKKTANSVYTFVKYAVRWARPKTPLQKEIKAELKEIKQLEQQKKDIDLLKDLKNRRKKLFKEVVDYEVEHEIDNVICDSCGNYMDYLGIDRSRREVYECKDCNLTLKAPLCTNEKEADE